MRPADGTPARRFSASDLEQAALLAAMLPIAVLLPEPAWRYPCRALAAVTSSRFFAHSRRLRSYLPAGLPALAGRSPQAYLRGQEARYLEGYAEILRERTWRWRPRITFEGREHLQAALAAGNGAILWVSGFESSDLIAKMALRRAGYRVYHLSRPTHGFSPTRFGVRWLNPVLKRAEDRYLGGRIVIQNESAVAALRQLHQLVAANEVVSITVGDAATSTALVPLPGGAVRVSTGPANLALRTGAALIPVFGHRERSGRFVVRLGTPLAAAGERAEIDTALARYAAQLDAAIEAHPEQWTGWRTGSFEPA